jgi:hypothetical protein
MGVAPLEQPNFPAIYGHFGRNANEPTRNRDSKKSCPEPLRLTSRRSATFFVARCRMRQRNECVESGVQPQTVLLEPQAKFFCIFKV